jgi:hypothetical protein
MSSGMGDTERLLSGQYTSRTAIPLTRCGEGQGS